MIGLIALLNVEEDLKVGPEPALTLHLKMVEPNAREMTQKAKNVTHKDVQLMVGGVTSVIGLIALLNVEEDLKVGPEPALTLHLKMVEPNAREMTQKAKNVTHKDVQLTRMFKT